MGELADRALLGQFYDRRKEVLDDIIQDLPPEVFVHSATSIPLEYLEVEHLLAIIDTHLKEHAGKIVRIAYERDDTQCPVACYCYLMDWLYKAGYTGRALYADLENNFLYVRIDELDPPIKH